MDMDNLYSKKNTFQNQGCRSRSGSDRFQWKRKRTLNDRFRFRRHNNIIVLLPGTICEIFFFNKLCRPTCVRLMAICCFSFLYLSWGKSACPSVLNWWNRLWDHVNVAYVNNNMTMAITKTYLYHKTNFQKLVKLTYWLQITPCYW